jgi:toxin-antitoxin system PIN domain toxin
MADLADSNVWLALTVDRHAHHPDALAWFEGIEERSSVRFCRMTQLSFLRLCTSKVFLQEDALTNAKAIQTYRAFQTDPRVGWADEPAGLDAAWLDFAKLSSSSPKRWMDAYLAAFARLAGMRLVTLDRGFRQYRKAGVQVLELASAATP